MRSTLHQLIDTGNPLQMLGKVDFGHVVDVHLSLACEDDTDDNNPYRVRSMIRTVQQHGRMPR